MRRSTCRGDDDRCRPPRPESPGPCAARRARGRPRTRSANTSAPLVGERLVDRKRIARRLQLRAARRRRARGSRRSTDLTLAPLPIAELISTSSNDGFRPSQCSARPSRRPSAQSGVMSELPIVWSMGWRELAVLERVERIDPAAAPVGPLVHPGELFPVPHAARVRVPGISSDPVRQRLGPRQLPDLADLLRACRRR